MGEKLKVTLVQMESKPDLTYNLNKILHIIQRSEDSELILFPELSLTGYQNFNELSFESVEKALSEIQRQVGSKELFLGSAHREHGAITNCYFHLSKEGIKKVAEKQLLFPGLDDQMGLQSGFHREVISLRGIRLGVVICFELRSPELSRFLINEGVSILLVPAQWPKSRIDHFLTLLKARALENQFWVIGINGVGSVGGQTLGGRSSLFSPRGEAIVSLGEREEVVSLDLELASLELPYPLKTPQPLHAKLKTLEELLEIITIRRNKGQIMVFTNGCFDILHAGHTDYLKKARNLGDFLVVGLNSDSSIRTIKGHQRPINNETLRAEVLSSLACVDYVTIFEEETPERLIKILKPDILVKGEDWEEDKIVGADFVKSYGGKVVRIKFNYALSTTRLINRIKELA
ncbi:MAG: D-glycero-beta-D-manno-heptose 1-phosphate adenylyltransferase [Caldimicrobium sp.]|nr:D-glycero-beta-D-manno-heptose 1-phosphate adenylyltransferase [Caldimicrobium sp.]MCX7873158.1 D-glycero-beta-D-manno-heptose 1-phosphate adenylyltransferase [Caldimicrobium sp.]MDW8094264.1 D-glycero-beta-D-manno-heptose 1-phosphate adenylyltransferase [Caldimicrobium sp.]